MSLLTKLSVSRRLVGGFGAVAILLCAVAAVAFISMRSMTSASDRLSQAAVPALEHVAALENSTQTASAIVTRHLYVNDGDAAVQRELDTVVAAELAEADAAITGLQALELSPEGTAAATAAATTLADFTASVQRAQKLSLAETLRGAEDRSGSRELFDGSLTAQLIQLDEDLTGVVDAVSASAKADGDAAASAASRGTLVVAVGSLLALILAGTLGLLITRSVVRPLSRLEEATAKAAEGDLTVELNSTAGDELGAVSRAFDGMIASVRSIVASIAETARTQTTIAGEMAAGAGQAGVAAGEIAGTVASVATGASTQAEAAQQTTDTVLEMARGVDEVARIGRSAAVAAGEADGAAADGAEIVREAIAAMTSIEQVVGEVSAAVEGLGERSRAIGQIVETISGIADQTNLLALNAAIEAARAGEQGRGFAVVADEVRKLAESSRSSASSIAGIVSEIQDGTDRAVATMASGRGEVESGTSRVAAAGEAFAAIRGQVGRLGDEVARVAGAAESLEAGAGAVREQVIEVAKVSEENAAAAEQVSAATEQTSASAQQVAASAERLAEGADELSRMVARFRVR